MLPILPNTPPGSRVWRVVHFPLVLLIIGIAWMSVAGIAGSALGINARHVRAATPWIGLLYAIGTAAICAVAYYLFVRLIERRRTLAEFDKAGWLRELAGGIVAGVALFSVVVAIIALLGGYRVIGSHPPAVLIPILSIAIVSGVTEEILLRGLFFRILETWLGSWIALALSAALFGALHLGNPNATLLAGVAIALEAGIMLAAMYMLTRRLWAAMGLHGAWNFAQGGIFGIPISGFGADGLLRPYISGSSLLTGGDFGAEASLPAIVTCVAFGIALLWLAWRRGRFVAPSWRRRADQRAVEAVALQS